MSDEDAGPQNEGTKRAYATGKWLRKLLVTVEAFL
jgi:hypothetical protein